MEEANKKAMDKFNQTKTACENGELNCSSKAATNEETRYRIRSDGTKELIDPFGNIQDTPIRPNIFPNGVVPCNVKGHE